MHGMYDNGWVNTHGGTYNPLLDLMITMGGVDVGDPQGDYPHLGLSQQGLQGAAAQGAMAQQQDREQRRLQALRQLGRRPGIIDSYFLNLGFGR